MPFLIVLMSTRHLKATCENIYSFLKQTAAFGFQKSYNFGDTFISLCTHIPPDMFPRREPNLLHCDTPKYHALLASS